jgi:hypothetical protein
MNGAASNIPPASTGAQTWIRRLARTITGFFAEYLYAQRKMMQMQASPILPGRAGMPDDYAEFLFRTAGWREHEPSARERTRPDGNGSASR